MEPHLVSALDPPRCSHELVLGPVLQAVTETWHHFLHLHWTPWFHLFLQNTYRQTDEVHSTWSAWISIKWSTLLYTSSNAWIECISDVKFLKKTEGKKMWNYFSASISCWCHRGLELALVPKIWDCPRVVSKGIGWVNWPPSLACSPKPGIALGWTSRCIRKYSTKEK